MAAAGCDRLYALKYLTRLRPVHEPAYRLVGTLIHECLAHHYAGKLPIPPKWYRPGALDTSLNAQANNQPEQVQIAREVYQYYKSQTAAESLTPLFVEQEFSASVGEIDPQPESESGIEDDRITCRTDLVALINGRVFIVDHKCTSGQYKTERLPRWQSEGEYKMSFQAMVNMLILSCRLPELGYPAPSGFMIQRIKRKPPFDMDRNFVQLSPMAMADAPKAIRSYIEKEGRIRAQVARGEKPAPNFDRCWGRYGKCDFHGVCSAQTQLEKLAILKQSFVAG